MTIACRHGQDTVKARRARAGLRLHLAVAALALGLAVFAPRPGAALLLVPLGPAPAGAESAILAGLGPQAALIGRGRLAGAWLVHPAGPIPLWALLRHGVVPLAVPAALCGTER